MTQKRLGTAGLEVKPEQHGAVEVSAIASPEDGPGFKRFLPQQHEGQVNWLLWMSSQTDKNDNVCTYIIIITSSDCTSQLYDK